MIWLQPSFHSTTFKNTFNSTGYKDWNAAAFVFQFKFENKRSYGGLILKLKNNFNPAPSSLKYQFWNYNRTFVYNQHIRWISFEWYFHLYIYHTYWSIIGHYDKNIKLFKTLYYFQFPLCSEKDITFIRLRKCFW